MGRIVSILSISMIVAVLTVMGDVCVPVHNYCGNFSPCCSVEKMVNGELKVVEAICDMNQPNGLRLCKPIDEVPNLQEIVETNKRISKILDGY